MITEKHGCDAVSSTCQVRHKIYGEFEEDKQKEISTIIIILFPAKVFSGRIGHQTELKVTSEKCIIKEIHHYSKY